MTIFVGKGKSNIWCTVFRFFKSSRRVGWPVKRRERGTGGMTVMPLSCSLGRAVGYPFGLLPFRSVLKKIKNKL